MKKNALEGNAVLVHIVEARLPHEGDVAGVGCLESPRQKGRYGIAADYTQISSGHGSEMLKAGAVQRGVVQTESWPS